MAAIWTLSPLAVSNPLPIQPSANARTSKLRVSCLQSSSLSALLWRTRLDRCNKGQAASTFAAGYITSISQQGTAALHS
ncbi:hypothetical protein CEP54_008579 [Fusarium duplospermum]|uniref:Uncharacterized protein n=1 Tax=Fusarium duplospermum TaxID=1325734 RepID=A0A428PV27_9HYPO|nr:hypothetical protein CEP54_008579 [Fusarium duplospermum]